MTIEIQRLSRRKAIARTGMVMGAALSGGCLPLAPTALRAADPPPSGPFTFCLNSGTLRGHKLGLAKEVEIVAQAGYQAIEPWVGSIEDYVKGGGSLKDLKKRIDDLGITVEDAIGFAEWIVDDEAQRAKGFERAKHDMDLVAQIGGKRLAAPPAGATNQPGLDLLKAAERYRALLELGDRMGIVPQLELWGFSKNLFRLGQCMCVAVESGHPKACVLVDVFHLYKGGSDYQGLKLMCGHATQVFHMNDYPSDPPRDKINDSFRVFPGDGIAPLPQILGALITGGGRKVLSLELFNKQYWEQDPLQVAKAGLQKMQAVAQKALAALPPSNG